MEHIFIAAAQDRYALDVFVQDGFDMLELSAIVEIVRDLNKPPVAAAINLQVMSPRGGPVLALDGISSANSIPFNHRRGAGLLILVGSAMPDARLLATIFSKARAHGRYVLALSGAATALKMRGAFGTAPISMPWNDAMACDMSDRHEETPDRIYLFDSCFGTSAGRFSAPHAILALLSRHCGNRAVSVTAERTLLGNLRSAHASQRVGVRERYRVDNPKLVKLIKLFEERFEEPLSVSETSVALGISLRQLQRLCRRELGVSPKRLLEDIRLNWARWRLEYSDMSITEIAYACGFGSSTNLATVFRRRYGKTPRNFREGGQPSEAVPCRMSDASANRIDLKVYETD